MKAGVAVSKEKMVLFRTNPSKLTANQQDLANFMLSSPDKDLGGGGVSSFWMIIFNFKTVL